MATHSQYGALMQDERSKLFTAFEEYRAHARYSVDAKIRIHTTYHILRQYCLDYQKKHPDVSLDKVRLAAMDELLKVTKQNPYSYSDTELSAIEKLLEGGVTVSHDTAADKIKRSVLVELAEDLPDDDGESADVKKEVQENIEKNDVMSDDLPEAKHYHDCNLSNITKMLVEGYYGYVTGLFKDSKCDAWFTDL